MQFVSNDERVRSDTVQDLKDFNSECLSTQVKKRRKTSFFDACY